MHNSLSVTRLCSSKGKSSGKPGVPEYLFCGCSFSSLALVLVGVLYSPSHAHTPFLMNSDLIPDLVHYMHNYSKTLIKVDFNADQLFDSNSALELCFVNSNDSDIEHWKTDVPFADVHDLISASIKSSIFCLPS